MKFIQKFTSTIFFILLFLFFKGAPQKRDSLWDIWADSSILREDRNNAIDRLAWSFMESNLDSAYTLGILLLDSAKLVEDKMWMSKALNIKGASKYFKANYSSALLAFQQSLKLQLEIDNKSGIANAHNLIGVIRKEQEDYDDALKHYQL